MDRIVSVGERMRQLRLNQLKGQKEIAGSLEISVAAYSKIENGITDINLTRLNRIADYFGVLPETLLAGEEVGHALVEENADLKVKLNDLGEYCILLQRKLIAYYELMEQLKVKCKDNGGVLDLLK